MIPPVIEGFVVDGPLPSAHPRVSRWLLGGDAGEAYVGGDALVQRARHLPTWGPFAPIRIVDESGGAAVVVVPGRLERSLPQLARRLTPGARVALAWHVAAHVAQLHESGTAHGALDSGSVGLDESGRLHVRPALHLDRDETAAAQVYDCFLLGKLFATLRLEQTRDRNVALVLQGLQGERVRLAPAWAVRQALMAILVRHPEWETELVKALGDSFRFDALDELEPPPVAEPPEEEDEVSLGPDVSAEEDPPTSPSFAEGPWAEFPIAEEDLPQNADEETEAFSHEIASAVDVGASTPPEPPRPDIPPAPEPPRRDVPPVPEEEPGAPVPDTPPQMPDEEPAEAPEQEEPDPEEAPEQEPAEEPTEPPREQPEGRLAEATVEVDDEPSFDVLDLVPPDAPEIALVGPGRTRELEFAWHEDPPARIEPEPAVVDVAALAASVAAAVDELPPVNDRWTVEETTAIREPVEAMPEPVTLTSAPPVEEPAEQAVQIEDPASVEETAVEVPAPVAVPLPVHVPMPLEDTDEPEPETVISNPRLAAAQPQRASLEFLDEPDTQDTGSQAPLFEPAVQVDDLPEPPRAPPPPMRPVALDEPRDGEAKWMAARGVTHDSARDAELGSGKWTEPARPLEELARELPKSPTRSMENVEGGRSGGAWLVLVALSFGLFTVAFFASRGGEEKPAAPPPVQATLRTQPNGAEVLVDGRTLGVSPVEVALPAAGKTIEVCAVWAGDSHCQKLSRGQLEKGYTFSRP